MTGEEINCPDSSVRTHVEPQHSCKFTMRASPNFFVSSFCPFTGQILGHFGGSH